MLASWASDSRRVGFGPWGLLPARALILCCCSDFPKIISSCKPAPPWPGTRTLPVLSVWLSHQSSLVPPYRCLCHSERVCELITLPLKEVKAHSPVPVFPSSPVAQREALSELQLLWSRGFLSLLVSAHIFSEAPAVRAAVLPSALFAFYFLLYITGGEPYFQQTGRSSISAVNSDSSWSLHGPQPQETWRLLWLLGELLF